MPTFNGIQIFVSHALGPRQVQIKKHKRNKRINKKWLKKFGTKTVDDAIVTPAGIYVSRQAYRALQEKIIQEGGDWK